MRFLLAYLVQLRHTINTRYCMTTHDNNWAYAFC